MSLEKQCQVSQYVGACHGVEAWVTHESGGIALVAVFVDCGSL